MDSNLINAVENVVKNIQEYESDTFSASHCGVDRNTAEKMAVILIQHLLFESDGMPGEGIDGAVVGWAFDVVTEDENDSDL